MSLHLIESRKVVSRNSRKRGGVMVSVVVHAVLIVSSFTLAAASPSVSAPRDKNNVVYVAPPPKAPPIAARHSTPEPAPVIDHGMTVPAPNLVPPIIIPEIIPDIDVMHTADLPMDTRALTRRTTSAGSGGDGSGFGGDIGAGLPNRILDEAHVEKVVAIRSGYRTPRYPDALRAAGFEQTVNVEFVVDTVGHIEPNSLIFREGAHPSFMRAVNEALANARFHPAEAGGRRVRQRVMQAFVFSLSRELL